MQQKRIFITTICILLCLLMLTSCSSILNPIDDSTETNENWEALSSRVYGTFQNGILNVEDAHSKELDVKVSVKELKYSDQVGYTWRENNTLTLILESNQNISFDLWWETSRSSDDGADFGREKIDLEANHPYELIVTFQVWKNSRHDVTVFFADLLIEINTESNYMSTDVSSS